MIFFLVPVAVERRGGLRSGVFRVAGESIDFQIGEDRLSVGEARCDRSRAGVPGEAGKVKSFDVSNDTVEGALDDWKPSPGEPNTGD